MDAAVAGAPSPGHSGIGPARPSPGRRSPGGGGQAARCAAWEETAQDLALLARAANRVTLSAASAAAYLSHPAGPAAFAPGRRGS